MTGSVELEGFFLLSIPSMVFKLFMKAEEITFFSMNFAWDPNALANIQNKY